MTTHWGIDFGTSNTTICEDGSGRPGIVHLPALEKLEPLTQTPVIPSAICILDPRAERVLVGQPALDHNDGGQAPGFAQGFKLGLMGREADRPVATAGGIGFSARDATRLYFRELLLALERERGERPLDLTVAIPTDVYESYRADLGNALRPGRRGRYWNRLFSWFGRRNQPEVRFVDEPVAAAIGYGVHVDRPLSLAVVDFGAASLEVACVQTAAGRTAQTGAAQVLAKDGIRLGGLDVDRCIVEQFAPEPLRRAPEWRTALELRAEWVKLQASAGRVGKFEVHGVGYGTLDRPALERLLEEGGLYSELRRLLNRFLEELSRHGLEPDRIDEVLLEGGSTLLPGVREVIGEVLGRDKLRDWMPFESVARGACLFAAGIPVEDFIYHDYALRVFDAGSRKTEYELLVPRGTRYPTPDRLATRFYSTSRDGQESIDLFVSEVGRVAGLPVEWTRRENGLSYFSPRSAGEQSFCVCLNPGVEAVPIRPGPSNGKPRIRVDFGVNAERWLCVTVHDLERKQDLRRAEPVVRLR